MLDLIIATLISLGFNASGGDHFTMNNYNAEYIQTSTDYLKDGGDEFFAKYVTIDDKLVNDIVIIDDIDPTSQN